MGAVASFHLASERAGGALTSMAGMVRQGGLARRVPGLRFARRLGTGRGRAMGLRGDLSRWALFAVWEDETDLEAFLEGDPLARRWRERSRESWSVRLAPLAAHGTWGGVEPLGDLDDTAAHRLAAEGGPVAVLTRATIPPRHWRAFHRSVPPVEAQLRAAAGLLEVTGVGEWPVGMLATFSLWRSADDVEAFAYLQGSAHHDVVRATRAGGWFAEELFARFRPYGSVGTWAGSDPLARATEDPPGRGNGS